MNVVRVKKVNGKWQMWVNFTDLNKSCPKDNYPLSVIYKLVDSLTGHKILGFMNVFSSYNKILMDLADQEKTSFIMEKVTYCYKVIPFGLKNVEATYQRLVNKVLKEDIGKTIEVYVDDMLVKSSTVELHIKDIVKTFVML